MNDIHLKKKFYGLKKAHNDLDRDFKEFLPKIRTTKEFFSLYNKIFYNLEKSVHYNFMNRSIQHAYPEGWNHPKQLILEDLRAQLQNVQAQIDSLEREHFFFKNGIFLAETGNSFNDAGNLTSAGTHGPYYVHSAKKRQILDIETYHKLKVKTKKTLAAQTDDEIIVDISSVALGGIPNGPPINTPEDIYISNLEVNIYPQTLDEYYGGGINESVIPTRPPDRVL
tara:strand:+ start:59 stop:733 length:675 start_codon:yes stop_codon:yes gene_type:complete